jgi:hypothetical protein
MLKSCLLVFLILPLLVNAQVRPSNKADSVFNSMMAQARPKHIQWVKATAHDAYAKGLGEPEIRQAATSYAKLGGMNEMDIEALCFLVLMQSGKSAREDLKAIMAKVKAINKQKQEVRDALERTKRSKTMTRLQLDSFKLLNSKVIALKQGQDPNTLKLVNTGNGSAQATAAQVDQELKKLQDSKDSLSEMGEEQQLKMQRYTERMSKADKAASDLLKKFSETASQIVQNWK